MAHVSRLVYPSFVLDLDAELILRDGQEIRVRPKTWGVLLALVESAGRVLTKDELLDLVWEGMAVSEDMPRLSVGELRRALGDSSRSARIIETVHGRGYRLLVQPLRAADRTRAKITVLPTRWRSQDAEEDWGIADGLATTLSRAPEVVVFGGESARAGCHAADNTVDVGRALGASFVLTLGRNEVQPEVFSYRLLRTGDGATLRDVTTPPGVDLVTIQEVIAEDTVEAVRRADDPPSGRIRMPRPSSAEAYHAYLRGLQLQNTFRAANWDRALDCFREAIELDASYAPAWAGRAAVCILQASAALGEPSDLLDQAAEAAERALILEPNLPEAHCQIGSVRMMNDWDFVEAERRFRTSIALRPSYSAGYFSYQTLLSALGRHEEAARAGKQAFELDPLSPIMSTSQGFAFLIGREVGAALDVFRPAVEDHPDNFVARLGLGIGWRMAGDYEAALSELRRVHQIMQGSRVPALIGQTLALAGRTDEAREVLKQLEKGTKPAAHTHRAVILAALGELDLAFETLSQALESREPNLTTLSDPSFDPLRDDQRFAELIAEVGLPEGIAGAPPS